MEQTSEQQSLLVLQKKLPMLVTMAVAIVLCCAVVLNFTRAWYSNNLDASAEGMQIISESPDVEFNLQIYDASGKLVYDSLNEAEYGVRNWVGLLPGEKYIFVLALNRSDTAAEQNIDLQIGFLGLSGKPLGAPFHIVPNQDKFEENAAAQTLSIPGNTIVFDASVTTTENSDKTQLTCVPQKNNDDDTNEYSLYFYVEGKQVTVRRCLANNVPEGAFSSTILNFSGYTEYKSNTLTFPAVKYETQGEGDNARQVMVAALMQTNTGHDSTEVFKIGCYATGNVSDDGTTVSNLVYKAPVIIELSPEDMANDSSKKDAISRGMINLSKELSKETNTDLLPLYAYHYNTMRLYEYHWSYFEETSNSDGEQGEGATTAAPASNQNKVLLIPFCIYVDTAQVYQDAGIINSSADLSNIQFSVDGIYISTLPPDATN